MNIFNMTWNRTHPMNRTDFDFEPFLEDFLEYSGGLCVLDNGAPVLVYAVVLVLLAIIATTENVIILVTMFKYSILRTPPMLLLAILALIDFLTGAVVTPLKVWLTVVEGNFLDIEGVFYTFIWMLYGVVFLSLATVFLISIDRFLQVFFLEKYRLTKKKLFMGLVILWSVPVVITVCVATEHFPRWLFWVILVFFFACVLGMVAAYIGMILALRKHTLGLHNDQVSLTGGNCISVIKDTSSTMTQKYIDDQRQAVRTTLLIICFCIFMNLPPMISLVAGQYGSYSSELCAITYFTLLANSAINPIIYCARVPIIRKHVLKLLRMNNDVQCADESEGYLTMVIDREP